jgi:ribosomal protein L11 methyltransferase
VVEPSWLEISLVVDGELGESLAELLSRYVEGGVVVESGVKYADINDEGHAGGPVRVFGYIPVNEKLESTRQKLENGLWHLGQIQALPLPQYRPIADQDWMTSWKKHYHPIPVGNNLLILPAWIKDPSPDKTIIRIDPSMAFGTGTHPTTQLCLEMVEEYCQPGMDVIDVGCGSGILSIAAIKLGAEKALAVDIDPLSVKGTRDNAQTNQVLNAMEIGEGSVQEILDRRFSIQQAALVLVNILAPIIIKLFKDGLAQLLKADGTLILSGILEEQESMVLEAASKIGLRIISRKQMGDWVSLALH